MIRVCAWCSKDRGEKPPYEDKSITHTICPECYSKMAVDQKAKKGVNEMAKYRRCARCRKKASHYIKGIWVCENCLPLFQEPIVVT